jgi:hypothetical protein
LNYQATFEKIMKPSQKTLSFVVLAIVSVCLANSTWALPIVVAPSSMNVKECDRAVAAAKSKLQKINKLQFLAVRQLNLSQSSGSDRPPNRPLMYSIILDGYGGESIMYSPKMMQNISTELIYRCQSVAAVLFGMKDSDWTQMFGLMNNGKVQAFECVDLPKEKYNRELAWGTQVCL